MFVLSTEDLSPKIQGFLKLWCLELKPNIYITGINKRNLTNLIHNIEKTTNKKLKITIIKDINKPPYYELTKL